MSGWVFLLVPAYPGLSWTKAVKWLCVFMAESKNSWHLTLKSVLGCWQKIVFLASLVTYALKTIYCQKLQAWCKRCIFRPCCNKKASRVHSIGSFPHSTAHNVHRMETDTAGTISCWYADVLEVYTTGVSDTLECKQCKILSCIRWGIGSRCRTYWRDVLVLNLSQQVTTTERLNVYRRVWYAQSNK